jgi:hypothetical protein
MKARSFITAMFVLAGTMAFAFGPISPRIVVISQKNSGMFKVIYEGEKTGHVKMNILDTKGRVIFSETTESSGGFIRPVNFGGMQPGEYTIEVIDGKGKQIEKLNYTSVNSVKDVHISKISRDGKYLLAASPKGTEEINVRIYDGENNLVHNENLTISGEFGLVYNLKNIAGVPTFEVTDKTGNVRTIKYY